MTISNQQPNMDNSLLPLQQLLRSLLKKRQSNTVDRENCAHSDSSYLCIRPLLALTVKTLVNNNYKITKKLKKLIELIEDYCQSSFEQAQQIHSDDENQVMMTLGVDSQSYLQFIELCQRINSLSADVTQSIQQHINYNSIVEQ